MKNTRLTVLCAVTAAHLSLILGFGIFISVKGMADANLSSYLELADFQYAGTPPGGGNDSPAPVQKTIAAPKPEVIDPTQETDSTEKSDEPVQNTVANSSSSDQDTGYQGGIGDGDGSNIEYLPLQKISQMPIISEQYVRSKLAYPEMARRAGIMGRVFLELFVDSRGKIRRVAVLKEDPAGYGFAEAAVSAFDGCACVPAKVNGQAVSVRFRYPIRFSLN